MLYFIDVDGTVDKRVCIVDMCVDKGSSDCLSHVICECLSDVTQCSNMKI